MWLTDLVTPVSTTNRNDRQLRKDDGTTNCCRHFFGAFHSKTNMTIAIAYSNKGFETSPLSSPGLLLHRHDFKYFIFQSRSKEEINYLMFLVTNTVFLCFYIVFFFNMHCLFFKYWFKETWKEKKLLIIGFKASTIPLMLNKLNLYVTVFGKNRLNEICVEPFFSAKHFEMLKCIQKHSQCILKRLQRSTTEIGNVPYHWKIISKHSENVIQTLIIIINFSLH